ncbi:hypothetical protein BJ508DRAFT_312348 [Ascobolus immersus RN42]|uniref:Uncharacterized protein n=1 Tax=Ascobolus immersus RN42 TaxID=1160509 RepID=A0A3N4HRD5_ASCIM|nr:hypothetical protein BJ508DRAFT_312348 [Ascobolus immersus RN42]
MLQGIIKDHCSKKYVPPPKYIDWPTPDTDGVLKQISVCIVQNQMKESAYSNCDHDVTMQRPQDNDDCPTTREALVERVMRETAAISSAWKQPLSRQDAEKGVDLLLQKYADQYTLIVPPRGVPNRDHMGPVPVPTTKFVKSTNPYKAAVAG